MVDSTQFIVAVIDDDRRILESLESLLESVGHLARVFPSAEAFLESGGLSEADCLISDIGMPGMNGFELQRLANAERPDLPVILITGRPEERISQSAIQQGAHRLLYKPFSGQELLAAVGAALRTR
jgi:FixJ family two-component response regulator